MKVDHIGILTKKIDKEIIDFFTKTFGCEEPKFFELNTPEEKMRYCHMRIGDNYIELLEPHEGYWVQLLKEKGSGALAEICFEVDDIEEFYDRMKERGITLVDLQQKPLSPNKKYCQIPGDDNKFAYFPLDKTFGTLIEVEEHSAWR